MKIVGIHPSYQAKCKEERVGPVLRGQHWIMLHGAFTEDELVVILAELRKQCAGLERKNVQE